MYIKKLSNKPSPQQKKTITRAQPISIAKTNVTFLGAIAKKLSCDTFKKGTRLRYPIQLFYEHK